VVGPEANRQILVAERDHFDWRTEDDPVTILLRRGLLVVDGDEHDRLRQLMDPSLYKRQALRQVKVMRDELEYVTSRWDAGSTIDMLPEMRKISLLVLMKASFKIDFRPDMDRMWKPILASIKFISPGPWILWPGMPRLGYRRRLRALDAYLFEAVAARRRTLSQSEQEVDPSDLLGALISSQDMSDDIVRDQLLTMLIAGHDTSTALLAWSLYLLGKHPEALERVTQEVNTVLAGEPVRADHLGQLTFLDCVIKESLRLYPPIHVGNRRVVEDISVSGCPIERGTRLMYSIFLSHRHPDQWTDADDFNPDRFDARGGGRPAALSYVPFGAGPRNCIGAAFAQIQAKVVLAQILSDFELNYVDRPVRPYMGATLEPRPGVFMKVKRRPRPASSSPGR
jgi:cytochrome P450